MPSSTETDTEPQTGWSRVAELISAPVAIPLRVAQDVASLRAAVEPVPALARSLLVQLAAVRDEVRALGGGVEGSIDKLREELAQLETRLAVLQEGLPGMASDLAETKGLTAELRDQVSEAVAYLPDPDAPGPLAKAREVLTGTDSDGAQRN